MYNRGFFGMASGIPESIIFTHLPIYPHILFDIAYCSSSVHAHFEGCPVDISILG